METVYLSIIAALAICIAGLLLFVIRKRPDQKDHATVSITLERIRSIGELSVMSCQMKEVIDHEIQAGSKFRAAGKALLICSYKVEFYYDMRRVQITVDQKTGRSLVVMPPHGYKLTDSEVKFYHEEKSAFLGLFNSDIDVKQRNGMLELAKVKVEEFAQELGNDLEPKIRESAELTVTRLAEAFGRTGLDFTFREMVDQEPPGPELAHPSISQHKVTREP